MKSILCLFYCTLLTNMVYSTKLKREITIGECLNQPAMCYMYNKIYIFTAERNSKLEGTNYSDLKVQCYDEQYNQLWSRKYQTDKNDLALDIEPMQDTCLLLMSHYSYENYPKEDKTLLIKIDSSGDEVWRKLLDEGPGDILSINGGFLLSSTEKRDTEQLKVTRFNNNGIKDWERYFSITDARGGALGGLYTFKLQLIGNHFWGFIARQYENYTLFKNGYINTHDKDFKFKHSVFILDFNGKLIEKRNLKNNGVIMSATISEKSTIYVLRDVITNSNNKILFSDHYLIKEDGPEITVKEKLFTHEHGLFNISISKFGESNVIVPYYFDEDLYINVYDENETLRDSTLFSGDNEYLYHAFCKANNDFLILFSSMDRSVRPAKLTYYILCIKSNK